MAQRFLNVVQFAFGFARFPIGGGRRRAGALRPRPPQQWQQPQCTEISGLFWIAFIDSAGKLRSSVDPEVPFRQPFVTTEAIAIGTTPNVLWAFTSDGGIHQSADAGCTWTLQARVPEAVATMDFGYEPRIVTAGPERVFVQNQDKLVRLTQGTVETLTLPEKLVELASLPADPSHLRAVGKYGAVYDSNDAGTTWYRRSNPFGELRTAKIDPSNFDHIVYGRDLGYSTTSDGGLTVVRGDSKYGQLKVWQIEYSTADPKVVWIDGYDFRTAFPFLLRSDDGAKTFGLETRYSRVGWVAPSKLSAHPFESLTFAAENNGGVRVIAAEGLRGAWIYGNYKQSVWSPAGTLYVLHEVAVSR
jgi:hypothetical protein